MCHGPYYLKVVYFLIDLEECPGPGYLELGQKGIQNYTERHTNIYTFL